MKIISFNVNGIRASVKKDLLGTMNALDADIFCLQETKAQDDQVREALKEVSEFDIQSCSAVKKGYSGTAIISKVPPIASCINIGMEEHDLEGRVIKTEYPNFQLVNVYVPNSGNALKRLDYRAEWDKAFAKYLKYLRKQKPLIVAGDFNVAHAAIDLARPKENYNKTSGYTQVEIDGLDGILKVGLTDSFRKLNPDTVKYTFWSQRFNARARNTGWRLDYFLVDKVLMPKVKQSTILNDIMGSDHCPIGLELDI